jgi:hypothetical protein
LDFILRGDGAVFFKANFKLRLDPHVLKDEVTVKYFDFSLKNLTSIRTSATETTAGFVVPHLLRDGADFFRRRLCHDDPVQGCGQGSRAILIFRFFPRTIVVGGNLAILDAAPGSTWR